MVSYAWKEKGKTILKITETKFSTVYGWAEDCPWLWNIFWVSVSVHPSVPSVPPFPSFPSPTLKLSLFCMLPIEFQGQRCKETFSKTQAGPRKARYLSLLYKRHSEDIHFKNGYCGSCCQRLIQQWHMYVFPGGTFFPMT